MSVRIILSFFALLLFSAGPVAAQEPDSKEKAAVATEEDGKYFDADGNPTFKIENGTVDWYTFSGYRRYHSDCHVCHGPDGVGSSYAPALATSLKTMDYGTFISIVAEGRKNVGGGKESVMPAFGDNKNVYCYMDDLYVYLRARAVGDMPRGRPPKKEDKPEAAKEQEASCMGG
ncbi:c-type cytochrome, methanol metabolism-related [Aquamicrobium sp. LC103]|uniref:c-type cytochrome, methanol metabolism-related n=1 Tax=Aquamicrobium sp. LC103 TaxID=1120658 RepID=UPI00063E8C29|nr:c-type cytochrome, methanol metabolism-related [Aquamicrobium sp. LC103]TKT69383.1 c-type cytochrome, methanol metabolism-related [Aquamicrobium sp. LC103]